MSAMEAKSTLKPVEMERPRCSSTPCSPIKSTVSGYQILHMNSNYLVGFTTGEELLKLAHKWSGNGTGGGAGGSGLEVGTSAERLPGGAGSLGLSASGSSSSSPLEAFPPASPLRRPLDVGLHRASRIYKAKSRYYQPYDIPAVNGRRRRRMPSSGDSYLRPAGLAGLMGPGGSSAGEPSKALHGPLPLCLLRGKRAQSKSLDYLNLDKMSLREPSVADTEVLQFQLQHLTLRGERVYTRNKT